MLELREVIHLIAGLYGLKQAVPHCEGVGEWLYCAQSSSCTDPHLPTRTTGWGWRRDATQHDHHNKGDQHHLAFTPGAPSTPQTHVQESTGETEVSAWFMYTYVCVFLEQIGMVEHRY